MDNGNWLFCINTLIDSYYFYDDDMGILGFESVLEAWDFYKNTLSIEDDLANATLNTPLNLKGYLHIFKMLKED